MLLTFDRWTDSMLTNFAALTITILLALTLVAPPPLAAQTTAQRDLDSIVRSHVLRVAMTNFDLPSFHERINGTLVGPEIDLANGIARALGVDVVFIDQAQSFNGVVDLVVEDRADIGISKLSQTYARLLRVRFSAPYVTLRHALLYERAPVAALSTNHTPDEVLRSFSGRIGVIQGSSYVDFAHRNFSGANLLEAPNWDAAIAALLDKRVDAIYRDEFEIRRILIQRPTLNVRFGIGLITDQRDFLSVAICNSCQKLQDFINFHLSQTQGAINLDRLLATDLAK